MKMNKILERKLDLKIIIAVFILILVGIFCFNALNTSSKNKNAIRTEDNIPAVDNNTSKDNDGFNDNNAPSDNNISSEPTLTPDDYDNGFNSPEDTLANVKVQYYHLTLKNVVSGALGDSGSDFSFVIELTPSEPFTDEGGNILTNVNLSYVGSKKGTIKFTTTNKGKTYSGKVTLKNKESIAISGIRENTKYEVTETKPSNGNYTVKSSNASGTINSKYKNPIVTFTNTKYLLHKLRIEKEVKGALGDKNRYWTIEIILTPNKNDNIATSYNYTGTKTGQLNFTKNSDGSYSTTIVLKHGEYIIIEGIKEKTQYSVKEVDANFDGHITRDNGNTKGTFGTTSVETRKIVFSDTKLSLHELTIENIVTGKDSNPNKEWKFDIMLNLPDIVTLDSNGNRINTFSYSSITFTRNGTTGKYEGNVILRHDEKVTLTNLPEGTYYEVSLQDANKHGYITSNTGNKNGNVVCTTTNGQRNCEVVVKFTNTRLDDSLIIGNEVLGSLGNYDKEWTYNIELVTTDEMTLEESYPYIGGSIIDGVSSLEDGNITLTEDEENLGVYVGSVTLKHGQTITILDLPKGIYYRITEVEENINGYVTYTTGETCGIIGSETSMIIFHNKNVAHYDLTLNKNVYGSAADVLKDWEFEITLIPSEGLTLNSSYSYTGSKSGNITLTNNNGIFTGHIKLKHNQYITIHGLPEGTSYIIKEKDANKEGYITSIDNSVSIDGEKSGVLNSRTTIDYLDINYASFDLTVSNKVEGSLGDKNKDWEYEIVLTAPSYKDIEKEYGYVKNKVDGTQENGILKVEDNENSGSYRGIFTLKHGESIVFKSLLEDTEYVISEKDANKNGYSTTYTSNSANILKNNEIVEFVNYKEATISIVVGEENKEENEEAECKFDVILTAVDDVELQEEYSYTGSMNGIIKFTKIDDKTYIGSITLKYGEFITINGIPKGINYVIEKHENIQEINIIEKNTIMQEVAVDIEIDSNFLFLEVLLI